MLTSWIALSWSSSGRTAHRRSRPEEFELRHQVRHQTKPSSLHRIVACLMVEELGGGALGSEAFSGSSRRKRALVDNSCCTGDPIAAYAYRGGISCFLDKEGADFAVAIRSIATAVCKCFEVP